MSLPRIPRDSHKPVVLDFTTALPCPFCGHAAAIQRWHGGPQGRWLVGCTYGEYVDECPAVPAVTGPTRKAALAKWNMRSLNAMREHTAMMQRETGVY